MIFRETMLMNEGKKRSKGEERVVEEEEGEKRLGKRLTQGVIKHFR